MRYHTGMPSPAFAWEFLTGEVGLSYERLSAAVFHTSLAIPRI